MSPPAGHPLMATQGPDSARLSSRAARRQAIFDTQEELAAQYDRPAFARWRPEQAGLLAQATSRRMPDGRWTLCCPPAFESYVFGHKKDPTLFHRMREIGVPLRIIAGDPDSPYASPSAAVAKAAHDEHGVDVAMIPGTTHFLQFEEPEACRDRLVEFIRMHGLDSE